jgi:single-strand DNA-binding protein
MRPAAGAAGPVSRPDREGEWRDLASSYFTVNCWRRMATNASASLRKGDPVIVWGKLRSRTWIDDNGERHRIIDIEADTICHDTSMGWTHFQRGRTPGSGSDETARRDLAAAEEMDARDDGYGDPADPADAGDAEPDAAASAGGDPLRDDTPPDDTAFRDGGPFADGNRFWDGDRASAGEPGESELPAATATDPVAALVTEAAPF